MASNEYYDSTGAPATSSPGSSANMRAEFDAIEDGFKKLPTINGSNNLPVFVNAGATALEVKSQANAQTALDVYSTTEVDAAIEASRLLTVPVGSIIPFIGGYFSDGSNGTFVSVLGNDVATINALLNSSYFYACDGANLNLAASPIYNGANRYLPNLTDSRFFMGSDAAGAVGGSNTMDHTHNINHTHNFAHTHTTGDFALTSAHNGTHSHTVNWARAIGYHGVNTDYGSGSQGSGAYPTGVTTESSGLGTPHNHGITGAASTETTSSISTETSGAASNTENRPKYISCIYIQKVA